MGYKTGRPVKKIDWKKVDQLLRYHCTGTGIAGVLGICADTLYLKCQEKFNMTFSAYSQQKKGEGETLLKAKQWSKALNEGDNTMLIWVGKQDCGQKDKSDLTSNGETVGVVRIEVIDTRDQIRKEDENSDNSDSREDLPGDS